MNKRLKYSGTDKMSDLICENYNLLLVMSRFGLSLGFGDQTVQQVCERQVVLLKSVYILKEMNVPKFLL